MRHLHEHEARASSRRIAVIGAGAAGLTAAWLLSRRHHVTLYEKSGWMGGHANTVDVACPEGSVPVDTGFIVFNEANYPSFTAMLAHLGVATIDADMSLGVSVDDGRIEYSSLPHGLFGQKRNLVRPRFWTMIRDILRFYRHATGLDPCAVDGISLGEFLEREGYGEALVDEHVLPMCAAIWSTTPQQVRDYPMRSFLRFFASHGLLQVANRPRWRTVAGGSRSYVRRMLETLAPGTVIHPAGARRVTRRSGLVAVEDARGEAALYTDIILATHADEALALLADPTPEEQGVLGAFQYTPNTAVLHDDPSLMPRRRSVWAAWNYLGSSRADADRPLCVSYWMNHLQSLPTRRQLFVTLNPIRPPRPASVIASYEYTHPLFDTHALAAQDGLWQLQGRRHTWFCGSYFGYGFHEDAVQSGIAVASALGVEAPWGATPTRIALAPAQLEAAE